MLSSTSKEEPGHPGFIFICLSEDGVRPYLRFLLNSLLRAHPGELMNDFTGAQAQPSALSTNKARGGVTGHHVRYVLGFGLAGIIAAFTIMGLLYGFGS